MINKISVMNPKNHERWSSYEGYCVRHENNLDNYRLGNLMILR